MIKYLAAATLVATAFSAADAAPVPATMVITLKNHQFSPSAITVAVGQPVRIELINRDGTAEEIDADDLGWDIKLPPHGKVVLPLPAQLKPGSYPFRGEYHPKTALGTLTVAAPIQP